MSSNHLASFVNRGRASISPSTFTHVLSLVQIGYIAPGVQTTAKSSRREGAAFTSRGAPIRQVSHENYPFGSGELLLTPSKGRQRTRSSSQNTPLAPGTAVRFICSCFRRARGTSRGRLLWRGSFSGRRTEGTTAHRSPSTPWGLHSPTPFSKAKRTATAVQRTSFIAASVPPSSP